MDRLFGVKDDKRKVRIRRLSSRSRRDGIVGGKVEVVLSQVTKDLQTDIC